MVNTKIFNHPELGKLRVAIVDNKPYFVGRDVSKILGYSIVNLVGIARNHVSEKYRIHKKIKFEGKTLEFLLIDKHGLDEFVISSGMPNVPKVRKWLNGEVLPEIHDSIKKRVKVKRVRFI